MSELEKLLSTRRDVRVCVIGLERVVSKYIGETEKNLSLAFGRAESDGAILFFDESDDLFGKRARSSGTTARLCSAFARSGRFRPTSAGTSWS